MDHSKDGLQLISDVIRNSLKIDVSVLMGANIASEVAAEKFCETTIGEFQYSCIRFFSFAEVTICIALAKYRTAFFFLLKLQIFQLSFELPAH